MSLIQLKNVSISFGAPALLEGIDLRIDKGERICLIGRNGEGKSTLLKIIAGELVPDDGQIRITQGVKIARLGQEVPNDGAGSVFDVVTDGVEEMARLLKAHHTACLAVSQGDETAMKQLERIQQQMEASQAWQLEQHVNTVISRMKLDPQADFSSLSGGMKRRVMLARALVSAPDLLLLDEPTNHLDIEAIVWLERFLLDWPGSLLFITHDRAFLRRLATRILELDRGRLRDWPGDYENYLRRRAELDHAETVANARFEKKLAQEEVWIRQGIKARRTRNEGRVRQLQALRRQARQRRFKPGQAKLVLNTAELSGKLVCEAEHVDYRWQGQVILRDFNATILRGDKVGIIGPNGCGKTTLLRLLLGELQPDAGQVRLGTRLDVAYFDQMRAQLDEQASVLDNVAGGREQITINGRSKHIIGYLQDFLFPPQRARQPLKTLSGGERNRLLLAKLFARPANVLVLDEPTNDLDVETLELLEELLLDYQGTLLLVSHDREFLDRVVTSTLVFEGAGRVNAYVGGYTDWQAQASIEVSEPVPEKKPPRKEKRRAPARKLSYKEQRELEQLPATIEALEQEQVLQQQLLESPEICRDIERMRVIGQTLQRLETELEACYRRWEVLERKRESLEGQS